MFSRPDEDNQKKMRDKLREYKTKKSRKQPWEGGTDSKGAGCQQEGIMALASPPRHILHTSQWLIRS